MSSGAQLLPLATGRFLPTKLIRRFVTDDPVGLWQHMEQYVAASSWVSRASGGNGVVFHPDVREPMRAILRDHQRPVWTAAHQRAMDWWLERALAAAPRERLTATAQRSQPLRRKYRIGVATDSTIRPSANG